jgi:predicted CxxxxCH...CXXCH cytochrome family protein
MKKTGERSWVIAAALVAQFTFFGACAGSGEEATRDVRDDASAADLAPAELAPGDQAAPDPGTADPGSPEQATPDTPSPDPGAPDDALGDPGSPDPGAPDSVPDASDAAEATPDTGTDAGPVDVGPPDVGPLTCHSCHGSEASDAPPVNTAGNSSTTIPSVGAHQAHLTAASGLSAPLACTDCHVVPATIDAAGHMDESPAELTFGGLATTGGANATWTHANASCSTTYCHGATLKGGTVPTPTWTKVDGTQDACGACHGLSPKTGRHPTNYGKHAFIGKDCTKCHEGQTNTSGSAITNAALHMNGAKDVKLQSGGTWNASNKSCNPSCHGNENW